METGGLNVEWRIENRDQRVGGMETGQEGGMIEMETEEQNGEWAHFQLNMGTCMLLSHMQCPLQSIFKAGSSFHFQCKII